MASTIVKPSSASRFAGVSWNTVSSATAVSRLATMAAPTPRLMSRRRCPAPILTRKVISAPMIRIASRPSRSMIDEGLDEQIERARSAHRAPAPPARGRRAGRARRAASSLGWRTGRPGAERGEVRLQLGGQCRDSWPAPSARPARRSCRRRARRMSRQDRRSRRARKAESTWLADLGKDLRRARRSVRFRLHRADARDPRQILGPPSALSTSTSDILPVVANAVSAGGGSPDGAGSRRSEA